MSPKGKIVIISGPSGSGKTTLYKKLLKTKKLKGKLIKSISVTTRQPRAGEIHGRDYFFVSRRMFQHKKRAGHFLESQKVFDNYYGTPIKNVREQLKLGKNVLLCIDVKGADVVLRKFPKAIRIFIKTSSIDVLKDRLLKRGSEDNSTALLRLKIAKEELKAANDYDYIIINDDLRRSYFELEQICLSCITLAF